MTESSNSQKTKVNRLNAIHFRNLLIDRDIWQIIELGLFICYLQEGFNLVCFHT